MTENIYRHLFGPVPSRRFGRSLGVDLVPFKTCTFDCVFCQLGRTTRKTIRREEYVPVPEVIGELDTWIKSAATADYITLSGSGEPTLHSKFGRIIRFVRDVSSIPVALLSNGSLLSDPDVRSQAVHANVVKISLSAWDPFSFDHVNRPHPDIHIAEVLEGARRFREMFRGKLWVEVFIVWGLNSVPVDVRRIAERLAPLCPDRVQLNTAIRPPAENYAIAAPEEHLEQLTRLFEPRAETIAEYDVENHAPFRGDEDEILSMLARRPCTIAQIANAFGMHEMEVSKYIGRLQRRGRIREHRSGNWVYFVGVRQEEAHHANL